MKALILSGGAARGAYEAGVAYALCERETFDIVCGTSIGAINGSLVAQDRPDGLREIWSTMGKRNVTKLRAELAVLQRLATGVRGIARGSVGERMRHLGTALATVPRLGVVAHLTKAKGLFDSDNIRAEIAARADYGALRRTFIAGVTNLSTSAAEAFAYFPPDALPAQIAFYESEPNARPFTANNYAEAVRASAALPPGFEPVDIVCEDGLTRTFNDGALTNNTPIRQAIDAGATAVTIIMLSHAGLREHEHTVRSLGQIVGITLDASAERMLELDLKLARRINEEVYRGTDTTKRFIDIRVIAPTLPLHLGGMNFNDQAAIDRVFAQGRADGSVATF